MQYRKPLLPYTNTYAARLKEGTTALLTPVELPGKRRRAAAIAGGSAIANAMKGVEVETDSDSDYVSEEEEEGYGSRRRSGRRPGEREERSVGIRAQQEVVEVKPVVPPRRAVKRTRHDYLLPYYRDQAANVTENLVPIRLDIDLENFKLKDSFMWNMK
ncbi:hypothetical protein HDU67_010429, partial [Dinochytrium kinnereticum]